MKRLTIGVAGVCVGLITAAVQLSSAPPGKTAPSAATLARGKYLVENIGLCADCHTPHDQKGEPIAGRALHGAPLFFKPLGPVPGWVDKAPNIAGLPGWTDEQAIKFFTTGVAYNDLPAGPPMPQFRYNRQDAAAVVAYLRSLTPAKGATLIKSVPAPQRK